MIYRNYSPRTIENYVLQLKLMHRHFKVPLDEISRDQFKTYAYYLVTERKLSNVTINQLISAWKILQKDVLSRDWENIKLVRPRKKRSLPEVLSQPEVQRLIDALSNLKHTILLQIAYSCGLRLEEIQNLKPSHIDSSRMVIRVEYGKGNKSREVPLSSNLLESLRVYYRRYKPKNYLIEGREKGSRYSTTSFRKVVQKAALKAGIKKRVSPHLLRHCFATHMLEKGINLKRLQMLMGHNSMRSTSIYLHLAQPSKSEVPDLLAY